MNCATRTDPAGERVGSTAAEAGSFSGVFPIFQRKNLLIIEKLRGEKTLSDFELAKFRHRCVPIFITFHKFKVQ